MIFPQPPLMTNKSEYARSSSKALPGVSSSISTSTLIPVTIANNICSRLVTVLDTITIIHTTIAIITVNTTNITWDRERRKITWVSPKTLALQVNF